MYSPECCQWVCLELETAALGWVHVFTLKIGTSGHLENIVGWCKFVKKFTQYSVILLLMYLWFVSLL